MSNDTDDRPDPITAVEALVQEVKHLRREFAFYERILTQAVLTHGKLVIDPSLADEAKKLPKLEFQGDGVTIFGSTHSLWPDNPNEQ